MTLPTSLPAGWIAQSKLLLDTFERFVGRPLMARTGDPAEDAQRLYLAPFAALSHGIEADPILNYANRIALEMWEMTPEVLVITPSRLTAEPMLREARERVLEETTRRGFISGYEGVRISATGRRFFIQNVTIWNLIDGGGRPAGQAATFDRWSDAA
ncbi:MAG: MEKHLA domain-containing protein [Hyphomicrobium sp.]